MSALQKALSDIREQASNTTELGNAFERLAKVFLENDATKWKKIRLKVYLKECIFEWYQ